MMTYSCSVLPATEKMQSTIDKFIFRWINILRHNYFRIVVSSAVPRKRVLYVIIQIPFMYDDMDLTRSMLKEIYVSDFSSPVEFKHSYSLFFQRSKFLHFFFCNFLVFILYNQKHWRVSLGIENQFKRRPVQA